MRLRAPAIDDASAVLEVLVARDIADIGVPDYVLQDLLDEWRASELDLAADSRVVELDGRIVAYAMVSGPGTLVAVAPGYEGRGIGARLLDWAEARERELGRSQHRQWIGSGNERGKTLLQASGYALARSYWRMGLGLEELRDYLDTAPAGLRLRSLDVDRDASTLHALDAASFGGAPDYHPGSLHAYREEHLGAHDLDPELSRVAELGGQIAGFLLARRWTEAPVGFVDILAVHPDHQRNGRSCCSRRSVGSAPQGSKKPSSGSRQPTRGPSGSTSGSAWSLDSVTTPTNGRWSILVSPRQVPRNLRNRLPATRRGRAAARTDTAQPASRTERRHGLRRSHVARPLRGPRRARVRGELPRPGYNWAKRASHAVR